MELTQRDYGYDISFTVKDSQGQAVDLTGVTKVEFEVVEIDTFRNLIDGECVIVEASTGKVKYTVGSEDFTKSGNYKGALRIVYPTKIITTKTFFITVGKKLNP